MANDPNTSTDGMTTKDLVLLLHGKVDVILVDHEKRLRWLERKWWALPASILTALIAAGAAIASNL